MPLVKPEQSWWLLQAIREKSLLQQFLSVTTVTFTKIPSFILKTFTPWLGSMLCYTVISSIYTASIPLNRMPELLPKDPVKVKSMPFLSHINKIHGEIKFPTGERIRAGLSDAVRSFLWTVRGRGPWSKDSPDYQGLQRVLASFGDACFRVLGFPGEKETSVAADWLFWKWLKSLVCVSVRTLWRERKWKASCKHLE